MSSNRLISMNREAARRLRPALILLAAPALALSACATTGEPAGPPLAALPEPPPPPPPEFAPEHHQQILAELPKDAPPGDCYARVVVPGQPVLAPPQAQGAAWVLNPGPPGSPGPIWCLVPTGPAAPVLLMTPEHDGWIRVLCDVDVTSPRIERWQQRLHREGHYRGAPTGRYDPATAEAVGRFQHQHHIEHGGYLSLETVGALEGPAPRQGPPPRTMASVPPTYVGQAPASAGGVGYAPYPAVAQRPAYGYPAYPSYPAYPQAYPAPPQAYAYPQAGYAPQAYAGQYGAGGGLESRSSSVSSTLYGYRDAQGPAQPVYGQPYAGGVAGYGYGQAYGSYGSAYGYAQGSSSSYSQGYSYGIYSVGPRPAYAAPRSAIQNGWLTWSGKSAF